VFLEVVGEALVAGAGTSRNLIRASVAGEASGSSLQEGTTVRVLVSGTSGFIGSAVVRVLADRGCRFKHPEVRGALRSLFGAGSGAGNMA